MPTTPPIKVPIVGEDRTATALRSATSNINSLGKTARSAMSMLGVGVGISAFTRSIKSAIDYGSAITDAATATRMGVEEYQVLKYAAQEAGAGMDKVTASAAKVQKAANDASNGLTTYTRAFEALGINVKQFQRLAPERQFETLGRAMINSENQAVAYASVLDIIGSRNAPRLMEVLQRLGSDGYDTVADSARKAGQVMSKSAARSMDIAADAVARAETRFNNFKAERMGSAILALTTGWDTLARSFETGESLSTSFGSVIDDMAAELYDASAAGDALSESMVEINGQLYTQVELLQKADDISQKWEKSRLAAKSQYEMSSSAYADLTTTPQAKASSLRSRGRDLSTSLVNMESRGLGESEEWYRAAAELYRIQSQLNKLDAERAAEAQKTATAIAAQREEQKALRREAELIKNPLAEELILQREIAAIKKELSGLNGLEAEEKRVELLEKQNELLQIQKDTEADAAAGRMRSKDRLLSDLGLAGSFTAQAATAGPAPESRGSHLMADYSNSAFQFNPWQSGASGAVIPDGVTNPADTVLAGAATSFTSAASDAVTSIQNIAETMQEVAADLSTLQQQVANAR